MTKKEYIIYYPIIKYKWKIFPYIEIIEHKFNITWDNDRERIL